MPGSARKNSYRFFAVRSSAPLNGQRHEVTATEGGFEYNGRRYKSLSAIAKAITGAQWSGPQFFGLRTAKPVREAS
jgi:hypothetical protein